jgi:hypothetical protein
MISKEQEAIASIIAGAEEITNTLDGLVQKTAADAGAPFVPEVLEELIALKKEQPSAFESLRAKLKGVGCRVSYLDKAMGDVPLVGSGSSESQAETLLRLSEAAELFHTEERSTYANINVAGHRETWPVEGNHFRDWLANCFYEDTQRGPSREALKSAIATVKARALFGSSKASVHLRVGTFEGRLYLDLCNAQWQAVEISNRGWQVVEKPPICFRRLPGMLALPTPMGGGSIEMLRSFLNVRSDADYVLVVAWILASLRSCGPYPLMVLSGEQGSAKSTFSRILKALVDPNKVPLRPLPRDERDLFIAASNSHMQVFDNLSGLSSPVSDSLCRLASGGGFTTRRLYADSEETLLDATRPIILNGIVDVVTRPDLADRAIFLPLDPISDESRRPEDELLAAFEASAPKILGALLDAVVLGLGEMHTTKLHKAPRMADFAKWAVACETAFWPAGTFMEAYDANRNEAMNGVIDSDPVAAALCRLVHERSWAGTATALLHALGAIVGERTARSREWPVDARTLSSRLKRIASVLRSQGIIVTHVRTGKERTRMISINRTQCEDLPTASNPNDLRKPTREVLHALVDNEVNDDSGI